MRPLLLLPLFGPGCAANLATLQGPETLAPGQISLAAELGAGLPAGTTARAVAAGVALTDGALDYASSGEAVPLETLSDTVAAGMGLALSPPGTVYGLSGRVGVLEDLDLGLRWSSSDLRLDAKWRFADGGDAGYSQALSLGYARHRFQGVLFDLYDPVQLVSELIPGLELQEPKRWDLRLQYLGGARPAEYLKVYGGLEARLGRYEVPWFLTGEDYGWPEFVSVHEQVGWNPIVNTTGGLALGKGAFWVRGELNLAWSWASTEVLGLPVNFGGPIVFPAASLEFVPPRGRGGR